MHSGAKIFKKLPNIHYSCLASPQISKSYLPPCCQEIYRIFAFSKGLMEHFLEKSHLYFLFHSFIFIFSPLCNVTVQCIAIYIYITSIVQLKKLFRNALLFLYIDKCQNYRLYKNKNRT